MKIQSLLAFYHLKRAQLGIPFRIDSLYEYTLFYRHFHSLGLYQKDSHQVQLLQLLLLLKHCQAPHRGRA